MTDVPFWRAKRPEEMTEAEWESLCDGCGLCCLVRFEEEESGEVVPTRVHCKLFDPERCACSRAGCSLWLSSAEKDTFEGWHTGYLRLEEATHGYYTRLLRLAAVGVVVLAGVGLWLSL